MQNLHMLVVVSDPYYFKVNALYSDTKIYLYKDTLISGLNFGG